MSVKPKTAKTFDVRDFGTVGLPNLDAFIPSPGCKFPDDLAVGESTQGASEKTLLQALARTLLYVTRVEDKPCV